jgi:hypothetical protein
MFNVSGTIWMEPVESELLYNWRFTANQFVLATSPLRLTTSNFIFQLNTCGSYVISSLTRGWVCRLQLLLVLASGVILRSHDHIPQQTDCKKTSTSKLVYDWRFTVNQFVLKSGPLRPTTRDFYSTELLQ